MKKGLLVLLSLILLTGCTVDRIDKDDYKQVLNKVLSLDVKMYNKVGNGYKYYAPRGVVRTDANTYNDVLKRDNRVYYLYVDVVSYYYKTKPDYKVNENAYYSSLIKHGNKTGYVEIKKVNKKLYVQMVYNYAKIETYVNENELKDAMLDMSYVLSSVKFNDSLLKKMYESGSLNSKEEVYKLFDDKEREGNFLEYIKEYDKYDGSEDDTGIKEEEIKVKETTTTKKETSTTTTTTKSEEVQTTTTSGAQ